MIGTIGESPGLMSNPAAMMRSLKYFVLCSNLSRNSVVDDKMSNTLLAAPTIAGAKELENKYGRER